MDTCRIVIATDKFADYPNGGGHWAWLLQYLWGLRALGHTVTWLDAIQSTGNRDRDRVVAEQFLARAELYGVGDLCCLQVVRREATDNLIEPETVYGPRSAGIFDTIRGCDFLWNMYGSLRQPLVGMFPRRVLIDVDPGHFQISAFEWDMGVDNHERFLTVGLKMHDPDCEVPTLGRMWHRFRPFVHLPAWNSGSTPDGSSRFTSVSHWTYGYTNYLGRTISLNKRDAYLHYVELPKKSGQPMEIAAKLYEEDDVEDLRVLRGNGWSIADPWVVCSTVDDYRNFILGSRAELCCPKPLHAQLKTGWFSDRSAAYLACGRPVLAEETGFSDRLPVGSGLLRFRNLEEAVEGVHEINRDYARHQAAARGFAEEFLDARKVLPGMIEASG